MTLSFFLCWSVLVCFSICKSEVTWLRSLNLSETISFWSISMKLRESLWIQDAMLKYSKPEGYSHLWDFPFCCYKGLRSSWKKSQDPEGTGVGTQICSYLDKYKEKWQSGFSWKSQDMLVKIRCLSPFPWRPKMEISTIRSHWEGWEASKWKWKEGYSSFPDPFRPLLTLIWAYLSLFDFIWVSLGKISPNKVK